MYEVCIFGIIRIIIPLFITFLLGMIFERYRMRVIIKCKECGNKMSLNVKLKNEDREKRYIDVYVKTQKCPCCDGDLEIEKDE